MTEHEDDLGYEQYGEVHYGVGLRPSHEAKLEPFPPEVQLLRDAMDVIGGERKDQYGNAEDSFATIAKYWSHLLGMEITPEQVGLMMILLKVARQQHAPKRDNLIDLAGYAALIERTLKK